MGQEPKIEGPYQIFVSYSHEDMDGRISHVVNQIVDLAKAQCNLKLVKYMDEDHIVGGWRKRLSENLEKSTIFMPFVSPSYFTREMCIGELATFVADAYESSKKKLIIPIFWKTINSDDRAKCNFNVDAEEYVFEYQGKELDGAQVNLSRGSIYEVAAYIRQCIDEIDNSNVKLDNIDTHFKHDLDRYVFRNGKQVKPKESVPIVEETKGESTSAEVFATDSVTQVAHSADQGLPVYPESEKSSGKGLQNHEGYAPAHELMVKIYNTVAETPFVEGSKDRSSALKPEFRVPGVLETVSLTRDGVHPTQGMNFNLNSNAAVVYISANWQGIPNDGSGRAYEQGNDELGRFGILPRTHKLESYEPWEHDFDNTLANYLYRIKMSQPYAEDYIAHKEEWRDRYERFAAMPDVSSTYAKELFNANRFVSANSRLEFVRDGRLLPVEQIDNEVLNRTIIAIADPAQVDEVIACINGMHKDGIRYYRVGALLDTKSDATNFVNALKKYRLFLEQQ